MADYVVFTNWVVSMPPPPLSQPVQPPLRADPPMRALHRGILASLSQAELFRLQAAFLHWELLCRYFGWPRLRS